MRHILLAIVGLSPQVVTEAVYALFYEGRPVTDVHIITTSQGASIIHSTLLRPIDSPFQKLCKDLSIKPDKINFGPHNLHILQDVNGNYIDDITGEEDNERLLRLCLELTHRFTKDDDTVVSFLVAGGRKTMTSCLTLAVQLYGRSCDRIYHVLASPDFENSPDFWFPPKNSEVLVLKDRQGEEFYKDTKYANVTLVPIPFISIREQLDEKLLDRPRPPAELIQSLVKNQKKRLVADLANGKIIYGNIEMDLHPAQLALYTFFLYQKKKCQKDQICSVCKDCWMCATDIITDQKIAELYNSIANTKVYDSISDSGITNLNKQNFHSYKSKINKKLNNYFGASQVTSLKIESHGVRPETVYGIKIDKNRIDIIGL